jgi:uncharacterized integral membrane protein
MRYWLTAIAAAALAIAGGWLVLLNQGEVAVRIAPTLALAAPLGVALVVAFVVGAVAVGLLATSSAVSRSWRARQTRRRARLEARGREAIRVHDAGPAASAARAELMRLQRAGARRIRSRRVALWPRRLLKAIRPPLAGARKKVRRHWRPQAARSVGPRAGGSATVRPRSTLGARCVPARARGGHARLRDQYAAESAGRPRRPCRRRLLRARTPAHRRGARSSSAPRSRRSASGDPVRAARQLRGLAREAPDFIPAWVGAGDRYAQAGRSFAARRAWVRGLRRRAAAVLLDRIEAHDAAAGQPQRTTRLLRTLVRRHPADVGLALRLARHLLARGEQDAPPWCSTGCRHRCRPRHAPRRAGAHAGRSPPRWTNLHATGPGLLAVVAHLACATADRWDAGARARGLYAPGEHRSARATADARGIRGSYPWTN